MTDTYCRARENTPVRKLPGECRGSNREKPANGAHKGGGGVDRITRDLQSRALWNFERGKQKGSIRR